MTPAHWTPDSVTGWRIWVWPRMPPHIVRRLSSITIRHCMWNREMPPASCDDREWGVKGVPPHASPDERCMCGYWSLKPDLIKRPQTWHTPMWDVNSVFTVGTIGWVESWGDIIEYEQGYRSSRIKMTALVSLTDEWIEKNIRMWMENSNLRSYIIKDDAQAYQRRLEEAAETYGLPIVSIEDALTV